MRVLVTNGETRAGLAVTRSLGRAGHEVLVGASVVPSLAQASRYCSRSIAYPDPATDPKAFLDTLAGVVRDRGVQVLIPVGDITTFLVTRNRARFEPCAVPFASAATLERAADKVRLTRTAEAIGVPTPRSVTVSGPDAVPACGMTFPLVVKPWQSRIETPGGWASSSVSYAADRPALLRDLAARPRHEFPVMLQERIVGPGIGVFACYNQGRPVALFGHRRLRERPPWGGVSVLSESVELAPQTRDFAIRLLDALDWHGVAMVEFKLDVRDNVPKLMEINGRFWGSLQLAVDAGVDFPALLGRTVGDEPFGPQPPYRVGIKSRWLWGDFDSLLQTLARKGRPVGGAEPSRVRAVMDFLKLWSPRLRYDNPKLDDVGPWMFETSERLGVLARRSRFAGRRSRPEPGRTADASALTRATPQVAIVRQLEKVGLDEPGWNALALRSDTRSVFQTHEWMRAWQTAFDARHEPLFVTVSDASGVVAVAPLMTDARKSGRIRFLGDGRADYSDVLAGVAKPEAVSSILEALFRECRWDVIDLNNIPAASTTIALAQAACARAGFRTLTEDRFVCSALLIEGHEEAARLAFNKPSLRRRQNYFEKRGRLVARDFTAFSDVEPYLDAFFEQHVARWATTPTPSLVLDPCNRTFYCVLARNLAARGWLLFSVIELDGQPISMHYGFDYNGSVIWYKPTYDPAFAAHSPGLLMIRHLIGYSLDRRRRELDFTVGDEPFKRRFANSYHRTSRIRIFRRTTHYRLARAKSMLANTVGALTGRRRTIEAVAGQQSV
jgi:CelD/BcsL family acetyltransferase involved in cellulose biosynthesis/predicted ATP-grasp superfamily ATP-dependent carboligase